MIVFMFLNDLSQAKYNNCSRVKRDRAQYPGPVKAIAEISQNKAGQIEDGRPEYEMKLVRGHHMLITVINK